MQYLRWTLGLALCCFAPLAATFGTIVPVLGGASDLVLDEARGRVYLVNTVENRIEIYSLKQRQLLTPVQTDTGPISAAMSRSGKFLYVTSLNASALDILDLDALILAGHVALPAQPEGVAVGADERVLISTIGSGGSTNALLIYDPNATGPISLTAVPVPPTPPLPPSLPPPSQRDFLATRSQLTATPDGSIIIGANIASGTTRIVFVYEVSSGTVLRTRLVSNPSAVVSVSPDGSKFMAGSALFDTTTLQVLAQENLANSPFLIATNANFNTQSVQGGSAFAPDGSVIYAAFNTSPQSNPPTSPRVSEFMLNDPDNLLIRMALQLPENLAGKMVISSDGANIYALSDSGFTILPISTAFQNPIAMPDSSVLMLSNDQCGVFSSQGAARVTVQNAGRGRMTATAQVIQLTPTGPTGLGGFGPGGGIIGGGGVIIILPPVAPGGTGGGANQSIFQTAPPLRVTQTGNGATLDFSFNSLAARALGTISPSHDFAIQSPEAINVPPRVRVYQNNRNAESRGSVIPVPVGISANESLVDMVYDSTRRRLYIANSGMNRVEVFDIGQQQFLAPIKVGQLPRSLALTPDGSTLYVVNTGGESISIVDPDAMQTVGHVQFPPVPLFLNQAFQTPSVIAAGLRGPLFLMTVANANGTSTNAVWQIIGNTAVPRTVSTVIGTANIAGPLFMANTPGGEYIVMASTNGMAYLYDAVADDFVQARQLTSANQSTGGYFGPITAGPRGQYYVVNGTVLNSALAAVNPPAPVPAGTQATPTRPIAAVASVSNTTFARFTQPIRTSTTALPADAGLVEIADAASGNVMQSFAALEGPMSQALATGRATTITGRTMALDAAGATAYVLTTSGLSVIPLTAPSAQNAPRVFSKGAVNLASYLTPVAQNGLLSIFGTNLAGPGVAGSAPLPYILGNTCVTLNNTPMPLFYTSDGQINAQIPPELATGNYSLVVRAIDRNAAAAAQQITVAKYAPAVLVDGNGQAAIVHADGTYVSKDHPANRDEPLSLFAVGLGLTTGGRVSAGNPSPSSPLAVTGKVQVFFGDPSYTQSQVIVDWSGLAPGFVGLYQLNLRVPGFHMSGDSLPVTLRINNVDSPSSGPAIPFVAVN